MAFLQNDASDVELEKWTLNIPYKQIAFLNNESSYDFSGVQIQKMTLNIP